MTLTQLFTNIANAIRAKTGSSSTIIASNFPTEITNIELGYEKSEGENLNLKNSANAQLAKLNINGNSVQDGTPTPSNQVPINSAGDNINLFDKTANITRGYTYTPTGGTTQLINSFVQEKYIEVESSKDYILSTTNSYISETDYRLVICEYDSSKNFIKRNLSSTQYYKITTSATTKYVRLCASTVTIDELKFEKGSIATAYTPYGMGSINEVISNKNLLPNNIESGTINGITVIKDVDGGYIFNGTAERGTYFYMFDNKNIKIPAGTYKQSVHKSGNVNANSYFEMIDINGNTVSGGALNIYNTESKTITSTKQCSYSEITIQNGAELSNFIVYPQLELGSSATSFVEHQEQNISIPCQQPMRSLGNVRDGFVKTDGVWYEKHNIGQVILNGSESWGFGPSGVQNINAANVYISSMLKSNFGQGLCNYFIRGTSKTANTLRFGANDLQLWFYVKSTDFANANDWKTWLSTHNTEVIYQLAEPIYLECTEEQITALEALEQARTYKPVTHISSADVVPAYLDLVYYKKI